MDIELATNDPAHGFALRDIRPAEADAFACGLEIEAGGFAAHVPFWPERWALRRFLDQLREMDRTLAGDALLQPLWEPEHVRLTLERSGAVWVSGEVGAATGNHLRFSFRTDQTVLAPLIRDLDRVLADGAPEGRGEG